jgi:hypothetical protein
VHLHLVKNEAHVMPGMLKHKANRHQLKHFMELAASRSTSRNIFTDLESRNVDGFDSPLNMLHEIHSQALMFLFHYWSKLHSQGANVGGPKDLNFVKRQQLI